MGSSSCTDRTDTTNVVSGPASSGKAAGRQRLAEALRANLGRRKAQKRDRANLVGAPTAQQETPPCEAVRSEPVQCDAITGAVPSQDDECGLFEQGD
jgi:hypothetical protein